MKLEVCECWISINGKRSLVSNCTLTTDNNNNNTNNNINPNYTTA